MNKPEKKQTEFLDMVKKDIDYFSKLSTKKQKKILTLLREIQEVQNSNLSFSEKTSKIKNIMWTNQSTQSKLFIGGFLGTLMGLFVFGTGGIGVAAFGGAVGIWGFLAGTAGGVLVSSLIQNFEKEKKD